MTAPINNADAAAVAYEPPEDLNLADHLLDARVREGLGDKEALRLDDRSLTYREMQALANRAPQARARTAAWRPSSPPATTPSPTRRRTVTTRRSGSSRAAPRDAPRRWCRRTGRTPTPPSSTAGGRPATARTTSRWRCPTSTSATPPA